MITKKQIDRFWSNVDIQDDDDCWVWKGKAESPNGYGTVRITDEGVLRYLRVHRLAWSFTNGEIPEGINVCHKCDVRKCCNPTHLFLGTAKDNIHDCIDKGRFSMGEIHYKAKFTEEQVREIKFSMRHICADEIIATLGVDCTRSAIYLIRNGHNWKHIRPRLPDNSLLNLMMQTQGSC